MPSSPSGAASESLPRSWSACHGGSSSGNKPHRLKPVAELLPFDGDLLDEESALREAGAFPEDYAPDHAAHAAPALWWPHRAPRRGAHRQRCSCQSFLPIMQTLGRSSRAAPGAHTW